VSLLVWNRRAHSCVRWMRIYTMHPHEWALKMQTHDPVTEDDYLAFLAQNALEWNVAADNG